MTKFTPKSPTITAAPCCGSLRKACRTGGAMKDAIQNPPAGQAVGNDAFAKPKMIRPSLNRHAQPRTTATAERPRNNDRQERNDRPGGGRKLAPPDQTNAENFYYQKQMQSHTPMVVILTDGEEVHGVIEWYDRNCIKLNRNGQPNLMIYKPSIKYMYKESENGRG